MVQSHSVTGMHHVDTVFTNWFYPQNSELLHAVGILLTGRDTLSLFLNFGWLAVAFLAAWCVGRPYGRGVLDRGRRGDPARVPHPGRARARGGEERPDGGGAAARRDRDPGQGLERPTDAAATARSSGSHPERQTATRLPAGWPLAAAGLAVGLAAGTKVTVLAMAAALSVAVLVLAPGGRRWAAARLVVRAGAARRRLLVPAQPRSSPATRCRRSSSLGPISLPHPERLQDGRPDFSIAHYATDTGVWRHYFAPGLHDAFGALWPLVLVGAARRRAAGDLRRPRPDRPLARRRRPLRPARLPLHAARAPPAPRANRSASRSTSATSIPALLAGARAGAAAALLRRPPAPVGPAGACWSLVLLLTDRPDAVLHDPARLFALALRRPRSSPSRRLSGWPASGGAAQAVVARRLRRRSPSPSSRSATRSSATTSSDRFANDGPHDTQIPGMDLDSAYRWARGIEDARIGLAGTTAGFAGYGFYGTDLSNQVVVPRRRGPARRLQRDPDLRRLPRRRQRRRPRLPGHLALPQLPPPRASRSPRPRPAGCAARPPSARSSAAARSPSGRSSGQLDPAACGPANAPLREIPDTPS